MDEVLLNKRVSVERCVNQIRLFYGLETGIPFDRDFLRQDAIAMNLQRVCELSIDIANHLVKTHKLGIPQDSRESFALLEQAEMITAEQSIALRRMVGFRNTLVHDYRRLNLAVLVEVIESRLDDLMGFAESALQHGK